MKFPYELGEFLAYQETRMGRKLTTTEREVIVAWLPHINEAATENPEDFAAGMKFLDSRIKAVAGNPGRVKLLESVKYWMGQARKENMAA